VDKPTEETEPRTLEEQEAEYEKFVWANLRRNYIGHYLHGMLGMTGFRLVNAPTFLPAYMFALSQSNAIVGAGLALQQAGQMLSPLIGASQVEHRKRILPVAQVIGMGMRVPILGIALAGWFLPREAQLPVILGFLFMLGLFGGMQRVAFQVLLAKVIPVVRRGRLQAWRNLTGGLVAAALAYFAGRWFIEANVLGNGYATTFLLAFILTSLGLTALSILMREPIPPTVRPKTSVRERVKEVPALFRADPDFFFFTLTLVLAMAGRLAAPFYILYASQAIELTGANIGLLSLAFLGADTVANLVWGYAGDRFGFRAILLASLGLWVAATVLLMGAHAIVQIFAAFVGLGASQAGYMMSASTMALEFGPREDVPMRLALSGTAEGAMAAAGPLAGGIIAATLGYEAVFAASILFLLSAVALLVTRVKEPRLRCLAVRQPPPPSPVDDA
jgi:MFS family permease